MNYPIQVARTYVNPYGNIAASGLYRSYLTQDLANDFPEWMHLRQNPRSVGQQFIAATAIHMEGIERDLEYNVKSKFLNTAPVDEIDILYRTRVPTNLNLLDASASGVRCVAAPSGCSPSGVSQIWVQDVTSLEDFYYNTVPTRLEVTSSGDFSSTIDGAAWNTSPSGILDKGQKKFDVWKNRHDLSWCYADGGFRKQDTETLEDYEVYALNVGYGTPLDMCFKDGYLWWIGKTGSNYYLNLTSTKTQEPIASTLDMVASFNITGEFDGLEPSGILMDQQRILRVCDTQKRRVFELNPRYDYFTLDKVNRYVYFREDYRNSGVFISNN
jgi:hypothetical protein